MAGEMGKPDYEKLDREYMEGPSRGLDQFGSVIMTSSKFLNSARMRDVYAQEGLRKVGHDVPPTYMVHQAAMALRAELAPGTVILIKGSHRQKLGRIRFLLQGDAVSCNLRICPRTGLSCRLCSYLSRGL